MLKDPEQELFTQVEQLHLPELVGMTLGLEGDVTRFYRGAIGYSVIIGFATSPNHRCRISQNRITIYKMVNDAVAIGHQFEGYPLLATEGWGGG